jgi:hypothetical protein
VERDFRGQIKVKSSSSTVLYAFKQADPNMDPDLHPK